MKVFRFYSLLYDEGFSSKLKNFLLVDKNGEFSKFWWVSDLRKKWIWNFIFIFYVKIILNRLKICYKSKIINVLEGDMDYYFYNIIRRGFLIMIDKRKVIKEMIIKFVYLKILNLY